MLDQGVIGDRVSVGLRYWSTVICQSGVRTSKQWNRRDGENVRDGRLSCDKYAGVWNLFLEFSDTWSMHPKQGDQNRKPRPLVAPQYTCLLGDAPRETIDISPFMYLHAS